ncbi:hypothetical protein ACVGVM_09370 [Pseudonocardia bannensis]|uniref:Uncharacterized protein n=1 Tax=Pseudonocardia bannensis TaxID=630973 RepID=A0A848DCN1_9PSEU|nr:hypothetical protein [Pseudonocardia bannensis]NMH90344.1 hypothetical protein [Pseudonocardia bannensis]
MAGNTDTTVLAQDGSAELVVQLLTNPTFLAVAGGVALVLLIVTIVVVRRVWRRARSFAGAQSHRIEQARTSFQALAGPEGPQRTAARLRQRLTAAVAETDRQLAAAAVQPLVSATVADQHRELGRLSTALDGHLRGLQRDPDGARVQAALPEAERWTEQLCEIAAELRASVRSSATVTTDADVRSLGESTSDGVAALRAGVEFLAAQVRHHRAGR